MFWPLVTTNGNNATLGRKQKKRSVAKNGNGKKCKKNFGGWQSQVTKSAKIFGRWLEGIEPTLTDLWPSAQPLDQWQVLTHY